MEKRKCWLMALLLLLAPPLSIRISEDCAADERDCKCCPDNSRFTHHALPEKNGHADKIPDDVSARVTISQVQITAGHTRRYDRHASPIEMQQSISAGCAYRWRSTRGQRGFCSVPCSTLGGGRDDAGAVVMGALAAGATAIGALAAGPSDGSRRLSTKYSVSPKQVVGMNLCCS